VTSLDFYNQKRQEPSDIHEHLPFLKKMAEECNHITEMGVRSVCSSWAFLAAHPQKLICYDVIKHPNVSILERVAKEEQVEFLFHTADVLQVDIEETDLLFIDTFHTYGQLIRELNKHHAAVNKFIILHDTETHGRLDEIPAVQKTNLPLTTKKSGLLPAIADFLMSHPNMFFVKEHYKNNNGLTVLRKV
jgi:hypothetical protein